MRGWWARGHNQGSRRKLTAARYSDGLAVPLVGPKREERPQREAVANKARKNAAKEEEGVLKTVGVTM